MTDQVAAVSNGQTSNAAPPDGNRAIFVPVGSSLAQAERELILATLEDCEGNKTRAAVVLGISLKTLYNRLNTYQKAPARRRN
jgi:DNA-binding NtrC family response regulator